MLYLAKLGNLIIETLISAHDEAIERDFGKDVCKLGRFSKGAVNPLALSVGSIN